MTAPVTYRVGRDSVAVTMKAASDATPEASTVATSPSLRVRTTVDGQVMQSDDTATLLFDPVFLVKYISTIVTLRPGDLIATGTPAGVGHARDPKVYLLGEETVVTEVEGVGACSNRITKGS